MCLSCICLFVLHVLVFVLFLFLLVSGSWLRFVIVAFPGRFCYLIWFDLLLSLASNKECCSLNKVDWTIFGSKKYTSPERVTQHYFVVLKLVDFFP